MARSSIDTRHFRELGSVKSVRQTERGALLELDEEWFRVDVVRADILRLKLSHAGRFDEAPTYATAFEMPAPVAFTLADGPTELSLASEQLRIVIDKQRFCFEIQRNDGSPIVESVREQGGRPGGLLTLNDSFAVARKLSRDDAFYGLGERTGAFERRGRRFVLWNVDVLNPDVLRRNRLYEADVEADGRSTSFDPYYATIPFFYHARSSRRGFRMAGFFIDNGYKGNVELDHDGEFRFQFTGGQYTEYVFAGPEMKSVLEAYTFVTGRMPLPPLYSIGHHQCRWHDYTSDEVRELALAYRERQIPCDVLWLDIGYMEGYRVHTWNRERFPHPEKLLSELREQGFRCTTIVDPGVKYEPGYAVFDEFKARNLLCKTPGGAIYAGLVWPGRSAFPDFSLSAARALWAEYTARHAALGVAGIWNDMNEPATGEVDPFSMLFDRDGEHHPHERFHNQYGFLMAMATAAGLLSARPNERPFILSRAGFAGIQRYAAQWLGDNYSDWDHLAMGIPMALGMGISGQAFVGADIPGFAENATNELAARWFEYGALTPFCRCHNAFGNRDHYPWSFGAGVEYIARQALELRYRLLPYLYAAFLAAAESGAPVQRPLVFDFQDDREPREVTDQYLLGDALLVAPILKAGQTARHAYLPPGGWVDFHSGERHPGARYVTLSAPLGRIPLLARMGRVIPQLSQAPLSTLGFFPELIELHVFIPDHDMRAESVLYEDDGLSFSFHAGAFLRTLLTLTRSGNELSLSAVCSGQGFPEFRRERLSLVFYGSVQGNATLDGRSVRIEQQRLTFDDRGQGFDLTLELA